MYRRGPVIVYWDGRCPFCAAIAAQLRRIDTENSLRLVDYHDPAVAATALPRFTFEELHSEMHTLMPDGTWRVGYFAWAAVLRQLPKWRFLGRLMDFALLADIGPKVYGFLAKRRLTISKALGLPAPCTDGEACRLPT